MIDLIVAWLFVIALVGFFYRPPTDNLTVHQREKKSEKNET